MKSNVVEFITENTIFPNGMESKAIKFLQYLDCEKDDFYYPLTKIKKITELDTESSLALARFFCGSNVSLLEPQYVYVTHDDEVISISKNDFNKGIRCSADSFVTEDSHDLEHFDKRRLKFYFVRKVEAEYEEFEW